MKIKKSSWDIPMQLICLLLLGAMTAYLIINWKGLPDTIPGHYNARDVVDRWGDKSELLILAMLGWGLYLGMAVIEKFPSIWNTGVAVTEKNKEAVYGILKNMLSTLKLVTVTIFVFLTMNSALSNHLPVWFLPLVLISTFGPIIFFSIQLRKVK
ncbi:DUF1648 domain-containing protein [Aminipila luticellarii]|uniref:DUF1648 domain-containing protein n=1 Tax=Aminipila luticellarii TaxID=2507160 RepID=A0A410PSG3_9FIRM|nr:DUF1648 domain-containing protein [Aminipila luticellarii]QAT41835.1 DUF1648 domain-containing protein [Aminipila luticellarii]